MSASSADQPTYYFGDGLELINNFLAPSLLTALELFVFLFSFSFSVSLLLLIPYFISASNLLFIVFSCLFFSLQYSLSFSPGPWSLVPGPDDKADLKINPTVWFSLFLQLLRQTRDNNNKATNNLPRLRSSGEQLSPNRASSQFACSACHWHFPRPAIAYLFFVPSCSRALSNTFCFCFAYSFQIEIFALVSFIFFLAHRVWPIFSDGTSSRHALWQTASLQRDTAKLDRTPDTWCLLQVCSILC